MRTKEVAIWAPLVDKAKIADGTTSADGRFVVTNGRLHGVESGNKIGRKCSVHVYAVGDMAWDDLIEVTAENVQDINKATKSAVTAVFSREVRAKYPELYPGRTEFGTGRAPAELESFE